MKHINTKISENTPFRKFFVKENNKNDKIKVLNYKVKSTMEFKLLDKQEPIYIKWALTTGIGLTLLVFFVNFLATFLLSKFSAPLWLLTNFVMVIVYPFVLFAVLRKVDSLVPNMRKYSVASYVIIGVWVSNMIISSIIAKSFVLALPGLLPLLITFIIPGIYKIKNVKDEVIKSPNKN